MKGINVHDTGSRGGKWIALAAMALALVAFAAASAYAGGAKSVSLMMTTGANSDGGEADNIVLCGNADCTSKKEVPCGTLGGFLTANDSETCDHGGGIKYFSVDLTAFSAADGTIACATQILPIGSTATCQDPLDSSAITYLLVQ